MFCAKNSLCGDISDEEVYGEKEGGAKQYHMCFIPINVNENTKVRDKQTKATLTAIQGCRIRVWITYNDSVIEGTDEHVAQYHFFVRTFGLYERGYRCRHIETFSNYTSFGYDTDYKEIEKEVLQSVTQIIDAYRPIFK